MLDFVSDLNICNILYCGERVQGEPLVRVCTVLGNLEGGRVFDWCVRQLWLIFCFFGLTYLMLDDKTSKNPSIKCLNYVKFDSFRRVNSNSRCQCSVNCVKSLKKTMQQQQNVKQNTKVHTSIAKSSAYLKCAFAFAGTVPCAVLSCIHPSNAHFGGSRIETHSLNWDTVFTCRTCFVSTSSFTLFYRLVKIV